MNLKDIFEDIGSKMRCPRQEFSLSANANHGRKMKICITVDFRLILKAPFSTSFG
jgi:hypothetical protein